jgi:hypothetical protein
LSHAGNSAEAQDFGRALLAATVTMLVTIATTSPILSVPTVYWLLAGLCVAYAGLTPWEAPDAAETSVDGTGGRSAVQVMAPDAYVGAGRKTRYT